MGRIDQLLSSYRRYVGLPPKSNLPLSQRVWFVVYPPEEERRLAVRIDEFEIATKDAGRNWHRVDLTGSFADWMDTFDPDERDLVLADPDIVKDYAETQFLTFLKDRIAAQAQQVPQAHRESTLFAITGAMELYDFVHVSTVVNAMPLDFPGILLVFFPGEREGNTYRFLNARDGWDYLAVPILPES
jgi:hypothetical protein